MAQHREPPAYMEYAAALMARTDYRVLSLEERGLLWTLRNEYWVNGVQPADPAKLAKVLGFPADQLARVLPELRAFFVNLGGALRFPDLDDYRQHLDDRRARQSAGGRKGAEKTNEGRHGAPPATPSGKPRGGRGSLVKPSPTQSSKVKGLEEGADVDEWLNDYDVASNGR